MALKMTKKESPSTAAKWVQFDDDTKIQLVGLDNAEYQVAMERMRRRIQRNDSQFDEGDVGVIAGERTEHQNQCMLLSRFILKDWAGVQDAEGNPLKFTPDVAADLLEANIEFFIFVLRESGKISAEARAELAQTVGKSSPASSGKRSGPAKPRKGAQSTSASA
jgi:hypothetical protein